MIQKNTTFVLGAGASHPYGYPIGRTLIDNIIKSILHDEIYILAKDHGRALPSLETFGPSRFKILDDMDHGHFKNAYELLTKSKQPQYLPWHGATFVCRHTQKDAPVFYVRLNNEMYGTFYKVKLSNFQGLVDFLDYLRRHNSGSIDSFLRDHPQFSEIGRLMIAYELLKCENKNSFFKKDILINAENIHDDWYSYLLQDIKGGFTLPKEILKNRVNFVIFNYDMSLEYYFYSRLKDIEFFKDVADEYLTQLKITHVYGQLYPSEQWQDYGIHLDDRGLILDSAQKNLKTMMRATQIYKNIKLIGERDGNHEIQEIKDQIKNASNLVIIGFGFDQDNLRILGFPDINLKANKRIAYLDYGGRMSNVHDYLMLLKVQHQYSLVRSPRTSITDAYNHDLKSYSIAMD